MKLPAPNVNDEVWNGNCVQDVLLTSEYLKTTAHPSATITIQEMKAKGMGNSPTTTNHYRVMVEQQSPPHSIIDQIDHSPFHNEYISPIDPKVAYWVDLTANEVAELQEEAFVIEGKASGVAYCEFQYQDKPAISLTYLENKLDENVFKIGLDLIMPGRSEGVTNRNVSFPIYYGFVDKESLIEMINKDPFFNEMQENDTPDELVPSSLKPMVKQWFEELITALPDIVKKPPIDPDQNATTLTRYV